MNKKMQEWCWFDGAGVPRSKMRYYAEPRPGEKWSADGSSMFGADMRPMSRTDNSDVVLTPYYRHPAHPTLAEAELVLAAIGDFVFGINSVRGVRIGYEQEFYMYPIRDMNKPEQPGDHYCGIGTHSGRSIMVEHAQICLENGLGYYGWNSEVSSGQWEWQMDPADPYGAAIDLQLARIILCLVAEKHGYYVQYASNIGPDSSGSGLHTNVSTEASRLHDGGAEWLATELMKAFDADPIPLDGPIFGVGNLDRLAAGGEAPDPYKPSIGVADRTSWIRIPRGTDDYCEIRLPGANADPFALGRWIQGMLEKAE